MTPIGKTVNRTLALTELAGAVGVSPDKARIFMRAVAMVPQTDRLEFLRFVRELDAGVPLVRDALLEEAHHNLTRELSEELRRRREARQ